MSPHARTVTIRLGPLRVGITADEVLMGQMQAHFAQLQVEGDIDPHALIAWDGCHASTTSAASGFLRECRVKSLDTRLGATQMLLNEVLAALAPEILSLHGNALIHPDRGIIFLMGASGMGKTTLTREILGNAKVDHSGWKLLAEDFLLLTCARQAVWPFPRAAGLRDCPADAPPLLARTGFNTQTEARRIVAYDADVLVDAEGPLPLEQVTVVLLEASPSVDASVAVRAEVVAPLPTAAATLFLSWSDDAMLQTLDSIGIDVLRLDDQDACCRILLRTYPNDIQVAQLDDMCASRGVLILALTRGEAELAAEGARARPSLPVVRPLSSREGLLGMLRHLRRPRARSNARGSENFMRLASTLPHAVFLQLIPGGSPAVTSDCLRRALESAIRP